jgi:hypothetical protein
MIRVITVLALLVALSAPGSAAGGEPQAGQPWPAPTCEKPDPKPLQDRPGNDSGAIAAYNAKVHRFNRMSADFTACTKAYIDNIHAEIARLRDRTKARLQSAVDLANARVKTVAAQVNAAIAATSGDAPATVAGEPDPDFPPSTCKKPDKSLLKRTSRLHRVSAGAANAYDAQEKTFEDCTAQYIDRGKAEIQRLQENNAAFQKQTVARTDQRIDLLNQLAALAAEGATDAARQAAARLGVVSTDGDDGVTAVDRSAVLPP